MENKKKKKSKGKSNAQQQTPIEKKQHMVLDELPIPRIVEPRHTCSLCGQTIETILEAITEPDGTYSHFDCVIEKIKKEYNVSENDKVSYVGHGNFAIFTKDEEGKLVISQRIPYESKEVNDAIKKYVEGIKA